MPGDKTLTYYYDATGRKLSQVLATSSTVTKKTDYANEYIYENDTLQFINTAEGRYVANAGAVTGGEYQYHLKDHLGNVRLTFSTTQETESNTATLETANEAAEQAKFLRYSNAKRVNSRLFDKTNGSADGFSQRLSGGVNERYGLARSLSVMPGDTVKMEVYAKYVDSDTVNWTSALNVLMGQITDNAGGVVVDGVNYTTSTTTFPYPGLQNASGSSGNGPRAFLNWLIFDRDYNFITGGYQRMSTSAKENGQDVAHEKLSGQLVATQPGYVYIYLSNEETTPVDVFFDDFKVTQVKSPVVQMDDYYPFGLAFNSYSRENSEKNRWKFQGQEHIDDLDLGWDSFKWRNHMPDIGRFFNVDPLAEKYLYNSTYAFSENKVVAHVEIEGLEAAEYYLRQEIQKLENLYNRFLDKVESKYNEIKRKITQDGPTEVEKKNKTPVAVDEEQKEQIPPTNSPLEFGGTHPLYNRNAEVEGGKGGDEVMTQTGSRQTVKDGKGDDPEKVKVDTVILGNYTQYYIDRSDSTRDEGVIIITGGDTIYLYNQSTNNVTGKTSQRQKPGTVQQGSQ
jgi:RHS repeat-associated protein